MYPTDPQCPTGAAWGPDCLPDAVRALRDRLRQSGVPLFITEYNVGCCIGYPQHDTPGAAAFAWRTIAALDGVADVLSWCVTTAAQPARRVMLTMLSMPTLLIMLTSMPVLAMLTMLTMPSKLAMLTPMPVLVMLIMLTMPTKLTMLLPNLVPPCQTWCHLACQTWCHLAKLGASLQVDVH